MQQIKYWLPTLVWAAIIFYASSRGAIVTSDSYGLDFFIKKTAHFVEYFILSWLVFRSLKQTVQLTFQKIIILTFVVCVLYAVSDEYHQSYVPGREPRVRDILIDTFGISTALVLRKKHSD